MAKETFTSPGEVEDLLKSSIFRATLKEVLQYTATHYREAGFATYVQSLGNFALSDVVYTPGSELIERESTSVDLKKVLKERNGKLRSDVALVLHSHPRGYMDTVRHAADAIYPSEADLMSFEMVEFKNKGHVEAIVSPEDEGTSAYLYLLRKKTEGLPNYYMSDTRELTSALEASGFGQAYLYYDGDKFMPDTKPTFSDEIASLFN